MEAFVPYLIILAGLFSVAGGIFGWAWFLNSRRARIWVRLFGMGGARVFYVVLGLLIAGLGVAMATGMLPQKAGDSRGDDEAEVR